MEVGEEGGCCVGGIVIGDVGVRFFGSIGLVSCICFAGDLDMGLASCLALVFPFSGYFTSHEVFFFF